MLTRPQKVFLARLVRDNKHILFGKFSPSITKKLKEQTWDGIRVQLVDDGADIKDYTAVRDNEWSNMKRACIRRYSCDPATTTGWQRPSELDEIILETLGINVDDLVNNAKLFKDQSNETSDSKDSNSNPEITPAGSTVVGLPPGYVDDISASNPSIEGLVTNLPFLNEPWKRLMASDSAWEDEMKRKRLSIENELLELEIQNKKAKLYNLKLEGEKYELEIQEKRARVEKLQEERKLVQLQSEAKMDPSDDC